ncbi:MAG: ABC-type sugar transport system periplasmic component-like protein [Conexibacter sp.]|nr:ABC-type sugar transport system periplasmic component-like protein [Conexibacter sp.]
MTEFDDVNKTDEGRGNGPRVTRAGLLASAGLGALSLAALGCGAEATTGTTGTTGGGGGLGPKRKVLWAIDQVAAWQIPIDVGFHDAATLLGWEYKKTATGSSASTAKATVDSMRRAVLTKPDVIFADWWYKPQADAFADIVKQGIFTMAIESDAYPKEREKLGLAYVGVDNHLSGFTLATRMAEDLAKKGKRDGVFVSGIPYPGAINLQIQDKAIREGFAKYNAANGTSFSVESFEDKADSDVAAASGLWRAKITQLGGKFVGGTSGSDNFASIITEVMKTTNRKPGDVVLGAFRASEGTLSGIRAGWLAASSDQSYYPAGFVSTINAWMSIERNIAPLDYQTGGELIDQSNLALIDKREARIAEMAKKYKLKA